MRHGLLVLTVRMVRIIGTLIVSKVVIGDFTTSNLLLSPLRFVIIIIIGIIILILTKFVGI